MRSNAMRSLGLGILSGGILRFPCASLKQVGAQVGGLGLGRGLGLAPWAAATKP
jgi:hypothetical protein